MSVIFDLDPITDDYHREIARRTALLEAAKADAVLRHLLIRQCRRDPLFWFDNFAWTYDPRVAPRYLPFVPWSFQVDFIRVFLGLELDAQGRPWPIILEKSRDLGATWLALACIVYDWLFNPGADYGIMTRSGSELDTKSTQSLMGKVDLLIDMMPAWMLPKRMDRNRSTHTLVNGDTGAAIVGSLTTVDAFRGQRHKRVFIDEAAAVPNLGAVMASVDDVTGAPCMVSSARGLGNLFGRIANGLDDFKVYRLGDKGVGWAKLRLHYSQHPDRKPGTPQGDAWIEREKARRTPERWAQEQEIDYRASAPGRIWPEFDIDAHVYTDDTWDQVTPYLVGAQLLEGWDFGSGASLTACVRAAYVAATDTLYVLDMRQWKSASYKTVARDYRAWPWPIAAHETPRVVGDIAGKARDSAQRSWLSNLKSEGIAIEGRVLRNGDRVRDRIRVAIADGRLYLSPRCHHRQDGLPSMVAIMEQYRRDVKGEVVDAVGRPPQPRKDIYSHAADGLQYIGDIVWPAVAAGLINEDGPIRR